MAASQTGEDAAGTLWMTTQHRAWGNNLTPELFFVCH